MIKQVPNDEYLLCELKGFYSGSSPDLQKHTSSGLSFLDAYLQLLEGRDPAIIRQICTAAPHLVQSVQADRFLVARTSTGAFVLEVLLELGFQPVALMRRGACVASVFAWVRKFTLEWGRDPTTY